MDIELGQPATLVLSETTVREWLNERTRHQRAIDDLDQRISAASLLLGIKTPSHISTQPDSAAAHKQTKSGKPDKRREGTMTALVIHTLKKAEGGLTRAELKDIVTWSSFGPQLQRNKNALYNIIDRGVKRGEISAQDDRFYHQAVFQRIKSGELVEALRPPPKKTLPEMIRDIVRERAGGATSAQIKEALLRDKQVAPRLQRNNQYLYTVLGRMRDREELIRIGDHHHVPGQAVQISKNATMTIRKRGRLS